MSRKRLVSPKKKRRTKPFFIVLGEGPTEEAYIKKIKNFSTFANINLKFYTGDEESFAIRLQENFEIKSKVLLILDIDHLQPSDTRYKKIERLITKYNAQVFYNNYSFETWLLNHAISFSKPILKSDQYDSYFESSFDVKSWHRRKNERNITKVMNQIDETSMNTALNNIKLISGNKWDNNPSSNMDLFIAVLKK